MASTREASQTVKLLRQKLMEVFEENVEGLWGELKSFCFISLEEKKDLDKAVSSGERTDKLIDLILQKGEPACEKFINHLENMIPRFPALSGVSQYFKNSNFKEKRLKTFQELVEKLNMNSYLSSKLTLRDTLSIGPESLKDIQPKNLHDLPWHCLRKLMALNSTARNILLEKDQSKEDDDPFDVSVFNIENDTSQSIHPLDVLCVLLHCSDRFLQQEIVTKMSMCQFAVPLLLPAGDGPGCTFMLWAMRDIVKKWRPQSLADSKGFREENVVNLPIPLFSFVRLGKNKLSKSKILNQILNRTQQHHDFFIHDNMEGGNIERKISDGLVEMSWYFPSGKSDIFPDPIAVTNLRGDLETNWEQFRFLTRVSSAVFIFIESISEREFRLLSTCSDTDTQYYFIVTPGAGKNVNAETMTILQDLTPVLNIKKTNVIVRGGNANEAAFVNKIQGRIKSFLSNDPKTIIITNIEKETCGRYIDIDDNIHECQTAREHALNITEDIADVAVYKQETMKLQGDLWKQLSKVEKELCRMTKQEAKEAQHYQSDLITKRIALHKKQNEHDLPNGILLFINAITHLPQEEKQYFLKWMKFKIDSIARNNLSKLQAEYKEKCNNKANNPEELKQIDQQITDSSLGIEHFLCEIGQFYEAEGSMVKEKNISLDQRRFTGLPGIAADLLLDGFPLELIDGDASNIPLQWITDVLTELDNKTGGQCRMRVITVLGVQSTGKSTLLNTMFGLQLPVASGRCTRGAFMTLIKVNENIQKDLGCDFILVIDTEGLKASELALEDSYEHDNELATLVVGLSDITIVNMAMENTAEMKDILQIVVHAFLRMKEIGKKPSCQFVHQNVSDVSAHEKNMRDREKLLENLNEMTKVAAKMEKKSGITAFSDVMDYDLKKHNWYIPGLWQGVPPMAPVNSGYSEHVYELKKYLLEFMKNQKSLHMASTIPDFLKWVESLWRAVKHEKFIFSFRNSLVAEAYNKLSIQFSLWEWKFTKEVHTWVGNTENIIKNQKVHNVDGEIESQNKDLHVLLVAEEKKMLDLLEKYFESKSENAHLIERYREDFKKSVEFLRRELERNALSKCEEALSIQKGKLEIENIKSRSQKLIEENVINLLEICREKNNKLADEDVKEGFEAMWEKTLLDLKIKELKRHNVSDTILQELRHDLSSKGSALNEELLGVMDLKEHGHSFTVDKQHIAQSWVTPKIHGNKSNEPYDKVQDLADSLIDMCDTYVTEKTNTTEDYDNNYCKELLHEINTKLLDKTLHFTSQFELDIKLYIFEKASERFQKMHDKFIQANDPYICLENLKPKYLKTFLSSFQKKDHCRDRAKQFCETCLKPAMTDYIFKDLGKAIVDDILESSDNKIFRSRMFFQYTILEYLLKEMSFQKYVDYIEFYESFSRTWIFNYISKKYCDPQALESLQQDILCSIIKRMKDVLSDDECLKGSGVSQFLQNVCKMLKKELVISESEMKVITFQNTEDVEQFSSDILIFLTDTEKQILSELRSMSFESVLSRVRLKPQDELFRKVIGCGKQCPFCKVPCEAGGADHEKHFASVHKPEGLGKYQCQQSKMLSIDICSTSVSSNALFSNSNTDGNWHRFKEYRTYYPDWEIQPDSSIESSDYWKYIFVQFNEQFAAKYNAKSAELPGGWKHIKPEQALQSIKKEFNVT